MNTPAKAAVPTDALIPELRRLAAALEQLAVALSGPSWRDSVSPCPESSPTARLAVSPAPKPTAPTTIATHLERQGITLLRTQPTCPDLISLTGFARSIGKHHALLAPLLTGIKRALNHGHAVDLDLHQTPERELSLILSLSTDWHRLGLLAEKFYDRKRRHLRVVPGKSAHAVAFFTGRWLELAVREHLLAHAAALELPCELLENPVLRLPDGREQELDLLLRLGDRLLWFEAKSGTDYPRYLHKYAGLAAPLGIPAENFRLILVEVDEATRSDLLALHGLRTATLDSLRGDFPTLPPAPLDAAWAGN